MKPEIKQAIENTTPDIIKYLEGCGEWVILKKTNKQEEKCKCGSYRIHTPNLKKDLVFCVNCKATLKGILSQLKRDIKIIHSDINFLKLPSVFVDGFMINKRIQDLSKKKKEIEITIKELEEKCQ